MGIVVINLPRCKNGVRAIENREKEIVSPNGNWTTFSTKTEYENAYPNVPQRIIDVIIVIYNILKQF